MGRYVLRRLLQSIVLVFLISVVTFFIIHSAPGGPAILSDPNLTAQQVQTMKTELGLDRPIYEQYAVWLGNMARGQFGQSFTQSRSVQELILARLPATLLLGGVALGFAIVGGITMGTLAALRRNSLLDYVTTLISFTGLSVPTFWLGIILILLFAVRWGLLPSGGMSNPEIGFSLVDRLKHLILPAFVLSLPFLGQLARYTRASMVDALRSPYLATARAKGLRERAVVLRHGLRNALIPTITMIGIIIPRVVSGAAITETVFSWPGMGRLAVQAAFQRDYPLIMGVTLSVSVAVVLGNLLTDLAYGWLDPRIRLGQ